MQTLSFGVVEWCSDVVVDEVEGDADVDIDDVTVTSPFVPASSEAEDPEPQAARTREKA
jgi:hypothetical protein